MGKLAQIFLREPSRFLAFAVSFEEDSYLKSVPMPHQEELYFVFECSYGEAELQY